MSLVNPLYFNGPNTNGLIFYGAEYTHILSREISNAREQVQMVQYIWPPPSTRQGSLTLPIVHAIQTAISKGAEIHIFLQHHTRHTYHQKTAEELRAIGAQVHIINAGRLLHVKITLVDNCTTILATHNLTNAALSRNAEAGLVLHSENIARNTKLWISRITSWQK